MWCICVYLWYVHMCMKVEVTPLVTLFRPRGHTLFRRMQTPRLMDDHSGYFPGFSFTREIVIHPLGEPEGRPGPLFCFAFIFSWIQDAMKRLRAQLLWLSFMERQSKSSATAVPTPNSSEMYCAQDFSRIWHNQKYSFIFLCFIPYTLLTLHIHVHHSLSSEDVIAGWHTYWPCIECEFVIIGKLCDWRLALLEVQDQVTFKIFICEFRYLSLQYQNITENSFHVRHKKKAPLSWKHACLKHKRYSHIPKLWRNSLNFMLEIILKNNLN